MGASNIFRYGCISLNHCGFGPHAHVLRTLADGYHAAGFEMLPGTEGARHRRTTENTTGAIISIATNELEGIYASESHLPFPNTPVVRGIGTKWPHDQQEGKLNLNQKAAILGADFDFSNVHELPQNVMGNAIVSTPPLRLYRRSLWGACQHFSRNLPEVGRAGGCVSFEDKANKGQIPTWLGFNVKKPSAAECFPSTIKQITVREN